MSEHLNFELFNWINDFQADLGSQISESLKLKGKTDKDDDIDYLTDEERLIYKQVYGSLEFYIRKLDKLFTKKSGTNDNHNQHKETSVITITDSSVSEEYGYEVLFEDGETKITIPCWDEESVRQSIANIKKTYKGKDIVVINKRAKK